MSTLGGPSTHPGKRIAGLACLHLDACMEDEVALALLEELEGRLEAETYPEREYASPGGCADPHGSDRGRKLGCALASLWRALMTHAPPAFVGIP